MTTNDVPITFREASYAIFDTQANAVRTTQFGNLAIFSTRIVAEQWANKSGVHCIVVPVLITRAV
jgi:BarA-like signal transduction histidine kinase